MGTGQLGWCQGPAATACRVRRSASPCAEGSLGRHQGSSASSPALCPSPEAEAELSPLPPRRKQGQADTRTRQTLPDILSSQPAAWGSPARPQESPRGPSPCSPSAPVIVLPALCLPGEELDTLRLAEDLLPG